MAELHAAVKRGDLPAMRRLLESDPRLANARSETDARGTFRERRQSARLGGTQGRWRKFCNATLEDWGRAAEMIRAKDGVE